jgi:hypothetical protein
VVDLEVLVDGIELINLANELILLIIVFIDMENIFLILVLVATEDEILLI